MSKEQEKKPVLLEIDKDDFFIASGGAFGYYQEAFEEAARGLREIDKVVSAANMAEEKDLKVRYFMNTETGGFEIRVGRKKPIGFRLPNESKRR